MKLHAEKYLRQTKYEEEMYEIFVFPKIYSEFLKMIKDNAVDGGHFS